MGDFVMGDKVGGDKVVRVSFALGRTRLRLHGYAGEAPVLVAADNAPDEPLVRRP